MFLGQGFLRTGKRRRMSRSSKAILADRAERDAPATAASAAARTAVTIEICDDLDAIEQEWRRFEGVADCTVFQTFDRLASWQRQVGRRAGVRAAIVLGAPTANSCS